MNLSFKNICQNNISLSSYPTRAAVSKLLQQYRYRTFLLISQPKIWLHLSLIIVSLWQCSVILFCLLSRPFLQTCLSLFSIQYFFQSSDIMCIKKSILFTFASFLLKHISHFQSLDSVRNEIRTFSFHELVLCFKKINNSVMRIQINDRATQIQFQPYICTQEL